MGTHLKNTGESEMELGNRITGRKKITMCVPLMGGREGEGMKWTYKVTTMWNMTNVASMGLAEGLLEPGPVGLH